MKNVKVFLFFFFMVFAVCFALPPFLMISPLLEIPEKQQIAENGITINAQVVPGSESSTMSINDVAYYSVQYEFTVDDIMYSGKTSQKYTLSEVRSLKTVTIKYDPETFKSVLADYDAKTDTEAKTSLIFVIAFGVVDIIFWIVEIVFIVQFIRFGIVSLKGKEYTAKFVAIKPGVVYNGTPMYSIAYSWIDAIGEIQEGESGDDYTLNEAHAFELANEFKIMAYGNISKITSKPSKMIFKQAKEENVSVDNYYICPYCNSMLPANTTKCVGCGAPRKADSLQRNN